MKRTSSVALIFTCVVSLAVASGQGETSGGEPVVLSLGHGAAPSNPRHTVALQMIEWIEQESNGTLFIEIVPSESLGNDRQMAEALAMGLLDLSINSQGPIATYEERVAAIGLPFLFESPEAAYRVLDGEIGELFAASLLDDGIRVLAYWDNGFRHITNSRRPITTPRDLEGLKIRTPEDQITLAIFDTLGASPAPLAFGELYLALSQGVFDGQENPITNIYFSNLYEVQPYLSLSNHKYEMCPFIVSEVTWNDLNDGHRRLLTEAAQRFAVIHREETNALQAELLDELRAAGVQVNQADVPALRDATETVYDQFAPVFGPEFVARLVELASE